MDKLKLKNFMLENERNKVASFKVNIDDFINETHLDYTETRDADDHSHYHQATTDSNVADKQLHVHEDHLRQIEKVNFEETDVVKPGAVVKVNDRYLVVAVAESAFKFEGKEFLSISTEAPLYQCMQGKKEGDVCAFNNREFVIKKVY